MRCVPAPCRRVLLSINPELPNRLHPPIRPAAPARFVASILVTVAGACSAPESPSATDQPGQERTPTTAALEAGAEILQSTTPVDRIAIYLVGFHPMKDDPSIQMESHHFCHQVNEDFAQCVLYDGNTEEANLHGVEYIISERLYETLAPEERIYWHPHNYEILSGELILPGLPDPVEKEALRRKINSYGKTWHLWQTGVYGAAGDSLPLGPAHLAWSFNRDGEAEPGMIADRDRRLGIDSRAKREDRADLGSLARPQAGVDALRDEFPQATTAPAGVRDSGDRSVAAVPVVVVRP